MALWNVKDDWREKWVIGLAWRHFLAHPFRSADWLPHWLISGQAISVSKPTNNSPCYRDLSHIGVMDGMKPIFLGPPAPEDDSKGGWAANSSQGMSCAWGLAIRDAYA